MKSVLISIHPKWCELIANGKKTVEVRKTRPKLETPFKCYIYCTNPKQPIRYNGSIVMFEDDLALTNRFGQGKKVENPYGALQENEYILNGKVIGEFVCDDIDTVQVFNNLLYCVKNSQANKLMQMCLTIDEVNEYLQGKHGYNWHISDLVIYDKPKELHKFHTFCTKFYDGDHCEECEYFIDGRGYEYDESDCGCDGLKPIKRPPQSWCYVEG